MWLLSFELSCESNVFRRQTDGKYARYSWAEQRHTKNDEGYAECAWYWEKKKLTRYLCSHSQTTSAISVASRFRQLWLSYQNQLQTLRRPALLSRTSNSIGVVAQQTVAHVLICGVETAEYVWSIVFGVFVMREFYSALESTDDMFKGNMVSMHMRTVLLRGWLLQNHFTMYMHNEKNSKEDPIEWMELDIITSRVSTEIATVSNFLDIFANIHS